MGLFNHLNKWPVLLHIRWGGSFLLQSKKVGSLTNRKSCGLPEKSTCIAEPLVFHFGTHVKATKHNSLDFWVSSQVVKYWCVGLEHHRPRTWRTRDETLQSFSTWEHEKHRFVSYPIQSKSLDTILIEGQLNVMQAAVQGGGLHAQVEVVRVSQVFKKQHLSTCPWLGLGKHCVWVKITALFVYFPSWAYLRYACNLSYLMFWMQLNHVSK